MTYSTGNNGTQNNDSPNNADAANATRLLEIKHDSETDACKHDLLLLATELNCESINLCAIHLCMFLTSYPVLYIYYTNICIFH